MIKTWLERTYSICPIRFCEPKTSVAAITIAGQRYSLSEVESSHSDSKELLYLYPSDIGTLNGEQESSVMVVTARIWETCTEVERTETEPRIFPGHVEFGQLVDCK